MQPVVKAEAAPGEHQGRIAAYEPGGAEKRRRAVNGFIDANQLAGGREVVTVRKLR